jgi:hypothetical protein
MLHIIRNHFGDISSNAFLDDLWGKDGVILLYDENRTIQGFLSYMFIASLYRGETIVALHTGDTIISSRHWGSSVLFATFGWLVYSFMKYNRDKRCYWFLTTKGYWTYILLSLLSKRFFPRAATVTPEYEQGLIDHLATKHYEEFFDKKKGIITSSADCLKGDFTKIPDCLTIDPDIQFFISRNPGYRVGQELACLCEVSERSLKIEQKNDCRGVFQKDAVVNGMENVYNNTSDCVV